MSEHAWVITASLATIVFAIKSRWNYTRFPEIVGNKDQRHLDLKVVIPARNESLNILAAVAGFKRCDVIVVNDASEDSTAEIASRAGAQVVPAGPLPPGWLGKPNACLTGSRLCDSEWILFVDADTRVDDSLAAALVDHARMFGLDLVSAFLRQECVSLSERCLIPYAFALYFCGISAAAVISPKCGNALANGQCLLFRRSAYKAVGGHAAVAGSVIEDAAMARVMKQHGYRCGVVRAEQAGSVRMYRGFSEIWTGFEKNSFRFLLADWTEGAQVIVASILLTSYLPMLAAAIASGWLLAATMVAVMPVILFRPWYSSWKDALLVVPAIYLFQAVALNAMAATILRRKTLWKGRAVA